MGRLLVDWAIKSVREVTDTVFVVGKGSPPKEFKGARWLCEPFPHYSPLYGILTALKEAPGEKILIVPGDCPFVRASLLRALVNRPAPVFIEGNYLFALFRKVDFTVVEEMLREGEHRVRELHRRLKSKEVKLRELLPFDFRGESFKNLNYYKDYAEALTGVKGGKA